MSNRNPPSVCIDGLRFTIRLYPERLASEANAILEVFVKSIFGLTYNSLNGLRWYSHGGTILNDRTICGQYGYGMHQGSITIILTGGAFIKFYSQQDFKQLKKKFILELGNRKAVIKRLDIAVDYLDGRFGLDHALQAYEDGLFTTSGTKPGLREVKSHGKGDSMYVGSKEGMRTMLIYEKGKQLGSTDYPHWIRWELRSCETRDSSIPIAAIKFPCSYFVRSYPKLTPNLDVPSKGIDIRNGRKKRAEVDAGMAIEDTFENIRNSYGPAIDWFLNKGLSLEELVRMIRRPGNFARLQNIILTAKQVCTMISHLDV